MFISCTQCFVQHIVHSSARLHDYIYSYMYNEGLDKRLKRKRGAELNIIYPTLISLGSYIYKQNTKNFQWQSFWISAKQKKLPLREEDIFFFSLFCKSDPPWSKYMLIYWPLTSSRDPRPPCWPAQRPGGCCNLHRSCAAPLKGNEWMVEWMNE